MAVVEETGYSYDSIKILETKKDPKVSGCYAVLVQIEEGDNFEDDLIFIINNHYGPWEVIDSSDLVSEGIKSLRGLKSGEPKFF